MGYADKIQELHIKILHITIELTERSFFLKIIDCKNSPSYPRNRSGISRTVIRDVPYALRMMIRTL